MLLARPMPSCIYQAKMRDTMRLLQGHQHIVKQVFFMHGYDHASHFARVFRRLVGVSPREFRNSPRHHAINPLLD